MPEKDDTQAAAQPQADDMSKAFSMAAEIFASSQSAVPSSQPEPARTNGEEMSKDEIAGMLLKLLSEREGAQPAADGGTVIPSPSPEPQAVPPSEPAKPAQPGLGNIAAALPPIIQALSGKGEFIKPEKLNLIKALKPYMSPTRGDSIERAIRMANIAQATKSALTALGR